MSSRIRESRWPPRALVEIQESWFTHRRKTDPSDQKRFCFFPPKNRRPMFLRNPPSQFGLTGCLEITLKSWFPMVKRGRVSNDGISIKPDPTPDPIWTAPRTLVRACPGTTRERCHGKSWDVIDENKPRWRIFLVLPQHYEIRNWLKMITPSKDWSILWSNH